MNYKQIKSILKYLINQKPKKNFLYQYNYLKHNNKNNNK